MSDGLYFKCLELALDWDNTEDIVRGCVDLVSKTKEDEIARLNRDIMSAKVDFGCAKSEIRRLTAENNVTVSVCNENTDLKKLIDEFTAQLKKLNFDYAGDVYYKSLELIRRGEDAVK
jgi:hypothetical protein